MNFSQSNRQMVRLALIAILFLGFTTFLAKDSSAQENGSAAGVDNEPRLFMPMISNGGDGEPTLEPIIDEKTRLLTDESNQYLEIGEWGEFVFSQDTAELKAVEAGDIIVSDVSPAMPDGYLRRIESMERENGKVILWVEYAALTDAIVQGSFAEVKQLTPDEAGARQHLPANSLLRGAQDGAASTFILPINEQFGDGVTVTGQVNLDMMTDIELKIENKELQTFHFITSVEETADLDVVVSKEASFSEYKVLKEYDLGTRTFFIGWAPIVVGLDLELGIGANGSVETRVTTRVLQTASGRWGGEYRDDEWSAIDEFSNSYDFDAPEATGEASVGASVAGRLELELYGFEVANVHARPSLDLSVKETGCWKLFASFDAVAQIAPYLLAGWDFVDFETTLFEYRELLDKDDSPQCQTVTLTLEGGQNSCSTDMEKGDYEYDQGETVTITAFNTPGPGSGEFVFSHWNYSNDDGNFESEENPLTLTLESDTWVRSWCFCVTDVPPGDCW